MASDDAHCTITGNGAEVAATLVLPGRTPARALSAFTSPALLKAWWPGELTTELKPGGAYRVHFPTLGQTMSGVVETYEEDERLVFTWGWAHELALAGRFVVAVSVREQGDGAVLELRHGPRPGTAIRPRDGEVEGHLEGWEYFLPRLVQVV